MMCNDRIVVRPYSGLGLHHRVLSFSMSDLEGTYRLGQPIRLGLQALCSGCTFLHQRCILLGDLIHLSHRFTDLADARGLLSLRSRPRHIFLRRQRSASRSPADQIFLTRCGATAPTGVPAVLVIVSTSSLTRFAASLLYLLWGRVLNKMRQANRTR